MSDFSEGWEAVLQEPIQKYFDEIKQPPEIEWDPSGMQRLELQWDAEVELTDGKKEVFFGCSVSGEGEAQVEDEDFDIEIGDEISFGIELIPINNLQDMPVVLNTEVRLHLIRIEEDRVKISKGRVLGHKRYTVLEMFKALMGTIAALGTPEERGEKIEELKEQISEELPWDDIERKLLNNESEKKVKRKKRKRFIDPLGLFNQGGSPDGTGSD